MHYVPNVTPEDVGSDAPTPEACAHFMKDGRWRENPDPIVIMPGPYGYMVQFLGVAERDRIVKDYAPMLARVCKLKKAWCRYFCLVFLGRYLAMLVHHGS